MCKRRAMRSSDNDNLVFQLDEASPHWKLEVRRYLTELPEWWIGRMGPNDLAIKPWPPCSPEHAISFYRTAQKMKFMCHHNLKTRTSSNPDFRRRRCRDTRRDRQRLRKI